jgi:hypothetical protein
MNTSYFNSFSIENLFSLPDEPGPVQVYHYEDIGDDVSIPVHSGAFTIVLSRDVRRNVEVAADLAFRMAHARPAEDVWYINTYASTSLLKELFQKVIAQARIDEPKRYAATPDAGLVLPNLRILNVPVGQWDVLALEANIVERARPDAKQVVIINSFEYAPLTKDRKIRMAIDLLKLCDRMSLAFVLFSHEMKYDLQPGLPGRGALGILAPRAETISRMAPLYGYVM